MRSDARFGPRSVALLAFAFAGIALPGCGSAGETAGEGEEEATEQAAPDPAAMQEQMALMRELQSIDQVLTPIREEAMAEPELQAREQALVARVEAAIEERNPALVGAEARFDSLRSAYEAAEQAGDSAAVQTIAGELQGLQAAMGQAQRDVLQQEEITDAVEEFRASLFARMRELDPKADSLLDLAEEITAQLEAAAEENASDG